MEKSNPENAGTGKDFIRTRIDEDTLSGKYGGKVTTRLPPEPNGFMHIGHAKAFLLSYNVAAEHNGVCHLRFDDTNPLKEETLYVDAIKDDLHWLGIDWGKHEYYASDYYGALYDYAVELVKKELAYVDDLSAEEIREHRGTLTKAGINSPYRDRKVSENIDLLERMKNGEFKDGECVLRAKIDMASPNINMRDPVMYRIIHTHHHRTGDSWCIYPTYDWAHGQSDSIEEITHSLCDLGFEDHRPLYDWFLEQLKIHRPTQIEFARLRLTHTILHKRRLRKLVEEGHVSGWDDPRMPTIAGLKRRGYNASIIRAFIDRVGMSKTRSLVDLALLEFHAREELNKTAPRVMAVIDPVKVIIDNYPENETEMIEAENNPEDQSAGKRSITFSKELYIEREDFREDPPKKYFRMSPGREVRLKHAYYVTCVSIEKDADTGRVLTIHCTYDPATKGGWSDDGRKVKGTMHWVSAAHAQTAQIRVFDRLFTKENIEDETDDFLSYLNPESITLFENAKVEPSLKDSESGDTFQFLRQGYYIRDPENAETGLPVYNRIVALRDGWAKIEKKGGK